MNQSPGSRAIWINEDDAHFYSCHPAEDMTVEGLERLVDFYTEDTQVAGILFCCSMQKALFDSTTREPLYEGYEPTEDANQPFLHLLNAASSEIVPQSHGRNWVHNLWLLNRGHGINHLQVWLDRCRHHSIDGWLTVRMNDSHGLKEYAQRQSGENAYDEWCLLCPSTFWKEHPELRRAPYRSERSWEGAYDYGQEAVREHYLSFLREVCEKFDFDGLELDWMRWGMNFKPGHEREGRNVLTDFVEQVRALVDSCAERVGHPVQLGVRVPAELRTGWGLGYDAPAWARLGLVDQIVLGSFGGTANFDVNIEEWRLVTDSKVILLVQAGATYLPSPDFECTSLDHVELQRGVCANALSRGADGIYLFNDCYRESDAPATFKTTLQTIGNLATLAEVPRRHSVAFAGMNAPGDAIGAVLPIPLTNPRHGYDFGRMEDNISVRIFTGPVPRAGEAVLHLGFSDDTPPLDADLFTVRLNTTVLRTAEAHAESALEISPRHPGEPLPNISLILRFAIPLATLLSDSNLVEFVPPKVPGALVWAEISFQTA